ncbi:hypothetical protein [Streptomyces sp. NPDC001635]
MTALKPKPTTEAERIETGLRLLEAIHRCRARGWRTVTINRLVRIANGDDTALPPDPTTTPKSARGTHHA